MDRPPAVPEKSHHQKKSISVVSRTYSVYDSSGAKRPGARERNIKYGSGKFSGIVLDPQPGDSPLDPLNWPRWRKELFYVGICLAGAIVGIFRTLLVSVNGVLATQFGVSYTAAAAFTGVPLIFAAFSAFGASVLAQVCGKRLIYLVASLTLLTASLWNMHVEQSYGAFMASRIFQALGWGPFEVLLLVSIKDVFFVHERKVRTIFFNVLLIGTTWGAPILGGRLSQSKHGFGDQIMYVNFAQSLSILLFIIAMPETSYHRRKNTKLLRSDSASITTVVITSEQPTGSPFQRYTRTLNLMPYMRPFSMRKFQQSLRALVAPSTILISLLTIPLVASSIAIAQNVSLIFSGNPIFLFPARVGYLFALPAGFAVLAYIIFSFAHVFLEKKNAALNPSSTRTLGWASAGFLIGVTGLLAFGIYTVAKLAPVGKSFIAGIPASDFSLKIVSLLFGIIIAGSVLLHAAGSAHLASASIDLAPSHDMLQNIMAGILVMAFPGFVSSLERLKGTVIAITVIQIVLGSTVGAIMFTMGERIKRMDENLLSIKSQDAKSIKRWSTNKSFFEA
ncbi:major facilitator superfamily transporter [Phlyctema vagabunda]|uniref:Major facilitator superfamily transporter n=1 Tax=Phlyctema vagabunda TaxID=108571 RepID=A0ABR4PYL3_9HELO